MSIYVYQYISIHMSYPYSEMLLQGDREENITQENDGENIYIKI